MRHSLFHKFDNFLLFVASRVCYILIEYIEHQFQKGAIAMQQDIVNQIIERVRSCTDLDLLDLVLKLLIESDQ